jgi:hypothetical protein
VCVCECVLLKLKVTLGYIAARGLNLDAIVLHPGPPLWSRGQSSWLQIRRPGFDSRPYQKKENSESGTGST